MRISDWSSDVCSSDLLVGLVQHRDELADLGGEVGQDGGADRLDLAAVGLAAQAKLQIGEGLREADKHRSVDDTPAGGGAGMVMRSDVLAAAVDHALEQRQIGRAHV